MSGDVPRIDTFKELMNEIMYSYEYPRYELEKDGEHGYFINKLYIERDRVTYKTDVWVLNEGVYESVEAFYRFLQATEWDQAK